jgi:hypothetical protein
VQGRTLPRLRGHRRHPDLLQASGPVT